MTSYTSRDVPCQAKRLYPKSANCTKLRHVTSPDTLAAAIIALRESLGSQPKLAAAAGVSERQVKRWERGALPGLPAQKKLVQLGIPAELFIRVNLDEIDRRLRAVEAECARIRKSVGL